MTTNSDYIVTPYMPDAPPPMAHDIEYREPDDFAEVFNQHNAEPRPTGKKFILESFWDIRLSEAQEWLVKNTIPRRGVGALFGKKQTFKSFCALNIAFHVAMGRPWAGKRVTKCPVVYVAAEGAAGVRKRVEGFRKNTPNIPEDTEFYLISVAPNLGTASGDAADLIEAIKFVCSNPGLVVIDTTAQTLFGTDENGAGLQAYVGNANMIAQQLDCFCLSVHHEGHIEGGRTRGWSGFPAAMDVQIHCERSGYDMFSTLTVVTLKDEEAGICFRADIKRVVLGKDEDGDEISTLIVDGVGVYEKPQEDQTATGSAKPANKEKKERRDTVANKSLFNECVEKATELYGENVSPSAGDDDVRAAPRKRILHEYCIRSGVDDPKQKDYLAAERRFNRICDGLLNKGIASSCPHNGQPYVWLNRRE